MAPEQVAGDRPIDARTDVYALGAVLHEMLAGESAFATASRQQLRRNVMDEPVGQLAARRADVSSSIDDAVGRALAKDPDDRFPSAGAFAAALTAPPRRRPSESAGRMISARAALYAVSVMLIVGVAGGWGLARSRFVENVPAIVPVPDAGAQPIDRDAPSARTNGEAMSTNGEDMYLAVVDRSGRPLREIAANRPWTPRFSPDGRRIAYGAFGGRNTSDLWVTDVDAGTTNRLTDDDNDSNDPQWSADGKALVYSRSADDGKDLFVRSVGAGYPKLLAARRGTQFASDWLRDGSALLVTEENGGNKHDIIVQPSDGSPAFPYAVTSADETGARISPDEHWVAYTSDESGRSEVYLDSYPHPGPHLLLSKNGGSFPVWRADGRELYYWNDGQLVAVQIDPRPGAATPAIGAQTVLFTAPYYAGPNTMYDVSPDGKRFVIVMSSGGN